MSFKIDARGSKDQRTLYQYCTELYPKYEVIYEYLIPDLNQRIDIYIPLLGIAIEYHGIQHYKLISHFHKNVEDFLYALKLDKKKAEYLEEHGIKLVVVPYDKMVNNSKELSDLIKNTEYPDIEFKPFSNISEKEVEFKKDQKLKRQSLYNSQKDKYKEDPEDRKERLKTEKKKRKEQYLKFKERDKKHKD